MSRSDILFRAKTKLYRSGAIRRLMAPFVQVPTGKKWVFIVGCYNSGTTLLRNLVASHPEVDTLPGEGVAFTQELSRPEQFGWTRMWHACRERIEVSESATWIDACRVKKDWCIWLDSKKTCYLEKSIANSARLRWLDANFENAYFIAIIRNGYAVAEGIRRRSQEGRFPRDYPMDLCAGQWVVNNEVIERDAAKISRCMHLSYESLTTDPLGMMKEIFSFIGLSEARLEISEKGLSVQGRLFQIRNMNFESISRLSREDLETISRVAGDMLATKGYETL